MIKQITNYPGLPRLQARAGKLQITIASLLTAVFFIGGSLIAQPVASPSSTADEGRIQAQRERLSENAGVVSVSTRVCGVVPTIVPSPEYKVPSYDFVPKRMRTLKEREV